MSLTQLNDLLSEVFRKKNDLIDAVKVAKDVARNSVDDNLSKALATLSNHFASF